MCGAIYLIPQSKLGVLTTYERVEPESVMVKSEGKQFSAKTYIFPTNRASEKPPDTYLDTVLIGLWQHGYEEDIIEKVKHFALNP